jgi:hypothetical protein
MSDRPILAGMTVRYLMHNLGLIGAPETVQRGELGRMLGPLEDDGWFATEPAKYPGKVCPVSRDMIEAA